MTTQEIIDAVMKLPAGEQIEIVGTLLEKLSPGPDLSDDELFEELERRRADMESGRSTPIPWEEVRKNVFGE